MSSVSTHSGALQPATECVPKAAIVAAKKPAKDSPQYIHTTYLHIYTHVYIHISMHTYIHTYAYKEARRNKAGLKAVAKPYGSVSKALESWKAALEEAKTLKKATSPTQELSQFPYINT